MKTNYFKILTISLILGLFTRCTHAQEVLVDVTKSYSGINSIEIEGGWLDVSYEGGSSESIQVEAYLASSDSNQDIVFVNLGDVLKIKHERPKRSINWGNNRNEGWIKIKGPKNIRLDIDNSSGLTQVNNVTSDHTQIAVSSGKIEANNIQGDLTISGSSGKLFASSIQGDVTSSITSGSASLSDITGDLTHTCTSGSLDASQVDGEVNVKITSGNVKLERINQLGKLKFTSGSIRGTEVGLGPNTSFSGTSGSFKIQTFSNLKDFNYSLEVSSGSVRVGEARDSDHLEIDNGSSMLISGEVSSGTISIEN